ncbi:thiol peroxidase [Mycoplasmoides fastidiosum]|uniref:Thiol peroxidase n=1 Tax=Mycoplasmoides fastidiosum TaxID=92758 RepID=A0ABU0LYK7_9BACT|nr:redoxin domain-containing protein [Mycoplasmoides fastidiosum]MDQ0513779.1 thiol peroxidase [Mycoplasmoides fastidiosum]UUD37802.1 redoxin domain-containing protein [Mycoplasmoides fastidiosum]
MAIRDFLLSEIPGVKLKVGDQFPDFNLYSHKFEKEQLSSLKADLKVVMIVPSLSTSLCDVQMKELSEELTKSQNLLIGVSNDSPIIGSSWCGAKNSETTLMFSLAGSGQHGVDLEKAIGVYIPECEFLAYRAVFVLDSNNKVLYAEYAPSLKTGLDLAKVNEFVVSHKK